ncbi:T9SS type A sorting domain-containing protein [Flavicella sediminum]|uniref:T9SS type A sorting domain-containing protein n=1 Tax=Flavicella sediminum TaxID=2585141 RepID=UPI001407A550|nr:T9SS type A sorting domain-containing protein [Flavicella sediminum]
MKRYIYILLLVIIIKANAQSYPFSLPDNLEATIEITSHSRQTYNNLQLGTNIHHFKTTQEKSFVNKFDPITVRFPHGLWSNWYDWRRDVSRVFGEEKFFYEQGTNKTPREETIGLLENIKTFDRGNIQVGIEGLSELNSAKKFQNGKGYDMMWTFNMSADGADFTNGSPESVARYKDLVAKGFEVKDVEMGNECFYPGQRSSIIPNAAQYIARAKSMSAALKAQDPNIRVSIPLLRRTSWANPNWNKDLTADLTYFDAVTVHTYVGSDPDNAANSDEAYGTALTARKTLLASVKDFAHKVAPTKPIWLTEWGVKSGGPNAVSALGAVDCFLMMSENQDVFDRANWFSTNGKLNSMVVWEKYFDSNNKEKERIKYPLEKTLFGSAYEITRSVLENSQLIKSTVDVASIANGVKAVNARVVRKDGKTTVFVVNLSDKEVPFLVKIDGNEFSNSFVHKAMAFTSMGEERAVPIDVDPLTLVKEGTGGITLPKFSINTIVLNSSGIKDVFVISSDNYTIKTTGETCENKENGQVVIEAKQSQNYTATLNQVAYSFTNELTINNLIPGIYDLCITIEGGDYEQCFEITIDEVQSLAGKMNLVKDKMFVDIAEGKGPYVIEKNGIFLKETNQKQFAIEVGHGDKIEVKGAFDCQGSLLKNIDLMSELRAYPNPTNGAFEILMPIRAENVQIQVFNMYSKQVFNKQLKVMDGRVYLDISSMARGIYMVKLNLEKPIVLKVMKE